MVERISSISIRTSEQADHPQRALSMRGYVALPTDNSTLDSTLTSVTGLESPALTVIGGEVSYGGSVFTGIIPNDREIVFTIKPRSLSVNDIKIRLNTLIAFSTIKELVLDVNTITDKGVASKVSTSGYITNVSAPVMAKDDYLVVTFRAPSAYMQRSAMNVTSSHTMTNVSMTDLRAVYKVEPKTPLDDSASTAPSPFKLNLSIAKAHASNISYSTIKDSAGNVYQTSHMQSFPGILNPVGDGILGADSYNRISTVGDTNNGVMIISRNKLITTVQPNWPTVFPSYSNLTVEIGFKKAPPAGALPTILKLRDYFIYPRVFGI